MHKMYELREMLVDELNSITAQNKMTQPILDTIDKLTHSIKSIDTILAMEESYSNDYRSYAVDRRGRNADGSYRTRLDGGRDQRYSRGYSRDIKEGLEHLMKKASPDERVMLEDVMRQLDD